ncbi:hypothetical protein CAPTEDRAFT_225354 [Capitella teleta]|uniref:BTB domain-containing protein n=1 Tax=Capitella teleta TaxID=283909 RepID=R7TBG1_CAPTE|nr:hypothetical protein CAPTEDRAFT_225354 [Capitella teleta]|eukprot:ELT91059.1 hypothetical protein CAPTEDRAFT_225354 [Capitella teleta]
MAATILRLNFRGVNVELDVQVLQRAPESRLHRLAHGREKLPLDNEGRHFIDRSPLLFHHILDYYSSGILDFPAQYSWQEVKDEVEYWQVDEAALSPVCIVRYESDREIVRLADEYNIYLDRYERMAIKTLCPNGAARMRGVWEFLDIPKSSAMSMVYSIVTCILLPLTIICNFAAFTVLPRSDSKPNFAIMADISSDWQYWLHVACLIVFFLEFLVRFIVWPSKLSFWSDLLNWFDASAIANCLAALLFAEFYDRPNLFKFYTLIDFLQASMAYFLLRMFRIWRCYDAYRILMLTVKRSAKDLFVTISIFYVIGMVLLFFAFFCSTAFTSMIDVMWYVLVTMTTVGYGDIIPTGAVARCVSALCALAGVFMIVLPIPALVLNWRLAKEQLEGARMLRVQQLKAGITYVAANSAGMDPGMPLYPPPLTSDVAAL